MDYNRKTILNIPIDTYQSKEIISIIERELRYSDDVKTIFAVNPEKVMLAQKDPEFFSILKEADFLIPDGIGIVLGFWLIWGERISRITGIMLMDRILDLAAKKKFRVFIFGSERHVNKMASESILNRYPYLELVGTQHGYIPREKYGSLIEKINSLKTDILFVGLGSPKQEKWICQYKKFLKAKLCMGIGGSLDVISRRIPGTPFWLKKVGLEWFYRLIMQPSRLKRQIVLPKFALAILKKRFALKS